MTMRYQTICELTRKAETILTAIRIAYRHGEDFRVARDLGIEFDDKLAEELEATAAKFLTQLYDKRRELTIKKP